MTDLQVVLGGSGGIGVAVVRELAAKRLEVRAVSRHAAADAAEGVTHFAADVAAPAGAAAACDGAAVVYHCLQPPYNRWAEELPAINRAVGQAVAGEGAKLVVADNLYMYWPIAGPISEATPQQPTSRKGRVRKDCADALLAEHAAGGPRVTIGRAPDYYGPGGTNSIAGTTVFGAAVAGKAVRWPASADQPRSFSYLPDLARALVILAEHDAADGRAWIVPSAPPYASPQRLAHARLSDCLTARLNWSNPNPALQRRRARTSERSHDDGAVGWTTEFRNVTRPSRIAVRHDAYRGSA